MATELHLGSKKILTQGLEIRPLEEIDLEAARVMHNDIDVLYQLSDVSFVNPEQQKRWYASLSISRSSSRLTVAKNDEFVGLVRLDDMNWMARSVQIGLDIVYAHRQKGYARIVYMFLLAHFFDQVGLHRIHLVTLESNVVARNLYESLGFVQEGLHRQALFRNGAWHNLVQYSLLSHEFRDQS